MLFIVDDMSCNHCVATLNRVLTDVDANARLQIDLQQKTVSIDSPLPAARWLAAMDGAGFPARQMD